MPPSEIVRALFPRVGASFWAVTVVERVLVAAATGVDPPGPEVSTFTGASIPPAVPEKPPP